MFLDSFSDQCLKWQYYVLLTKGVVTHTEGTLARETLHWGNSSLCFCSGLRAPCFHWKVGCECVNRVKQGPVQVLAFLLRLRTQRLHRILSIFSIRRLFLVIEEPNGSWEWRPVMPTEKRLYPPPPCLLHVWNFMSHFQSILAQIGPRLFCIFMFSSNCFRVV